MTVAVVLAEPPVAAAPLQGLTETPLAPDESAQLSRAMLADVCTAIQESGADLLVNYRQAEQVDADVDPEAALRDGLRDLVPRPDEVRYEIQVGETLSGRVGNTVTHLLEEEAADSVVVVDPAAPFLSRADVGQATMKLRSTDVVLAPAPGARVALAGFTDTIDFTDAFATPAVERVTDRARGADLDVDFVPLQPVVETPRDLADLAVGVRARRRAGRQVPPATAAMVEDLGLHVGDDGAVATSDNS